MAGITLSQAETALARWIEADSVVSYGQSYSIGGRSFTRADASIIRENIIYWNDWVNKLSPEQQTATGQEGAILSQFDV